MVVRPDRGLLGAYPTLDIYLLRPDPLSLDPDYLAAFLRGEKGGQALRGAKAGSGLPRLPIDAVANLEIPLPSLERQRIIGSVRAFHMQFPGCLVEIVVHSSVAVGLRFTR